MAKMRIPLFRIWYSTTYTTLLIVLLLLLCVSPGDIIYQTIKTHEIQKLFVIGGVYVLTALVALLVYSTRIYTNRTVLAAMPKPYLPVEEGEVGRAVRRMIVKHLRRSAIVAWDSRPRNLRDEAGVADDMDDEPPHRRPGTSEREKEKDKDKAKTLKKRGSHRMPEAVILPVSPKSPPWGHVSHTGWASPTSPDIPDLQYSHVLCELPNLIEAKAVSLAPPDPALEDTALHVPDNTPVLPDAQIVALLQRPRAMGLREYLARLADFGLINPPNLGAAFLAQYEHARFSTECLSEHEFRDVMAIFAAILDGMTDLDPAVIEEARAQSILSDNRSLAPTESSSGVASSNSSHSHLPYRTPQLDRHRISTYSARSLPASDGDSARSPQTTHTAPSRQQHRDSLYAPSAHSLVTQSDTGSVVVHTPHRSVSASTYLPSSSPSSVRSSPSIIRLHPNPSAGELPYQYQHQYPYQLNMNGG
jgi:hypothetical protein